MKIKIIYFSFKENLEYETNYSNKEWKTAIKEAIEHFNIKNKIEISVNYSYDKKTGFIKNFWIKQI